MNILYYYSEYSLYDIVDICAEKSNIKEFFFSPVNKLLEYDKMYSTNFVDTLKTYISNRNNQYRSARALSIHRNTLLYRINKIQEIMEIDLNNQLTLLQLYLTFFMIDYTLNDKKVDTSQAKTKKQKN